MRTSDFAFEAGAEVCPPIERVAIRPFEEKHYSVAHWAELWGFSPKTIREWFSLQYGPGILRQTNIGRRKLRDYNTLMISPSAAARVYEKHTARS